MDQHSNKLIFSPFEDYEVESDSRTIVNDYIPKGIDMTKLKNDIISYVVDCFEDQAKD